VMGAPSKLSVIRTAATLARVRQIPFLPDRVCLTHVTLYLLEADIVSTCCCWGLESAYAALKLPIRSFLPPRPTASGPYLPAARTARCGKRCLPRIRRQFGNTSPTKGDTISLFQTYYVWGSRRAEELSLRSQQRIVATLHTHRGPRQLA